MRARYERLAMGKRVPVMEPELKCPFAADRARLSTSAILYCTFLPFAGPRPALHCPEASSAPEETRPMRPGDVWERNGWL